MTELADLTAEVRRLHGAFRAGHFEGADGLSSLEYALDDFRNTVEVTRMEST